MQHTGSRMVANARDFTSRVRNVVRRVVGVPDYDAYVRHVRRHHPEAVPMPPDAFISQCWEEKYSRPGHRCC